MFLDNKQVERLKRLRAKHNGIEFNVWTMLELMTDEEIEKFGSLMVATLNNDKYGELFGEQPDFKPF